MNLNSMKDFINPNRVLADEMRDQLYYYLLFLCLKLTLGLLVVLLWRYLVLFVLILFVQLVYCRWFVVDYNYWCTRYCRGFFYWWVRWTSTVFLIYGSKNALLVRLILIQYELVITLFSEVETLLSSAQCLVFCFLWVAGF